MRALFASSIPFALSVSVSLGIASCTEAQVTVAAADSSFRAGRYDEAIERFKRLTAEPGATAAAQRGLVRALMEVGKYGEAEEAARRAVSGAGGVQVQNVLGEVLVERGKREDARRAFEAAIAGNASDKLTADLNLAVLLFESGARADAMARFKTFIRAYNERSNLSAQDLTAVGTAVRHLGIDDPQLFKDALRAYDDAIAADPGDLEPRILIGELLLEKYNGKDAQAAFQDVLRLNPKHPRGLLGMARSLEFDGSAKATELARASLEVNSNLVGARVLLSRQLLGSEEFEAAASEAEKALEVNPSSLEALSALAAVRSLEDDSRAFDSLKARVLSLNPMYADFYNNAAEMSVQHRLYTRAVDLTKEAIQIDPKSWRAYGILGINQMRAGDIEVARQNLETSFKGDPYNVWNKNTLDLLDTFSRYTVTKSPRFEMMLNNSEATVLAPYFTELADDAYAKLSQRYGWKPERPVRVEVYPSHADFSVRTLGLPGLGALGVAFGKLISMDSPSAREKGEFNWGSTLWHELAHVFQLGLGGQRLPRWFAEGLAVYEERRARAGWGADVSLGFLSAYRQGKLLSLRNINSGFVRPAYPEQVQFSYYQASLVMELIERDHGFPKLLEMIREYAKGKNTTQVFQTVLNTDVDAFNRKFDAYMRERFKVPLASIDALVGEGARAGATDAPGDFIAQLAHGQRLVEEGRDADAVAYFERAKALFPEYGAPDSPYWHLAMIFKKRGDTQRAIAELSRLTLLAETNYDALLELATLQETAGDAAGAASSLDRALYIYPFDPAVHVRLADLFSKNAQHVQAVRERAAVVALNPVDRAEALYQLAHAYSRAGDRAAARREVLRALEVAPSFEKAQELLLEVQ
jgi:tetratricopeptide (TPR) repeat protein